MAKACNWVGCENNTQKGEFCFFHRPRQALPRSTKPIKAKKRYIKHESDKAKAERLRVRDIWFELNPPNAGTDLWWCYLNGLSEDCWVTLSMEQIIENGLEHKVPRVKSRAMKFEVDNLGAACPPCNKEKGSKTLDQLMGEKEDWIPNA